jgi:hypothetical protein
MTNSVIRCVLAAALLVMCFCAKPNQPEEPPYFVKTPMPDEKAEIIALYLSGELLAPLVLYERIHAELEYIWGEYTPTYPVLSQINYRAAFGQASAIGFFIDEATYNQLADSVYHAWDALNEMHEFETYRLHDTYYSGYIIDMYFRGRRHPCVLTEIYDSLPGFTAPEWCGVAGSLGDYPNIYPRMAEDTISYLFRNAWGDCPAGCIYSEFWYFVSVDDSMNLVGYWLPEYGDTVAPFWWEDAKHNWYGYHEHSFWGFD